MKDAYSFDLDYENSYYSYCKMFILYMKSEFAFVLVYVAAFGLSDIFVEWCRFNNNNKIVYYTVMLAVALMIIFTPFMV